MVTVSTKCLMLTRQGYFGTAFHQELRLVRKKTAPGFKAGKDHIGLFLCANATDDFKSKPMLIYHTKNLMRIFERSRQTSL